MISGIIRLAFYLQIKRTSTVNFPQKPTATASKQTKTKPTNSSEIDDSQIRARPLLRLSQAMLLRRFGPYPKMHRLRIRPIQRMFLIATNDGALRYEKNIPYKLLLIVNKQHGMIISNMLVGFERH